MATETAKHGTATYSWLPDYNPSEMEMDTLCSQITSVTGKAVNAAFRKTVWQLITLMRQNIDRHNNAPHQKNIIKAVEDVQRHIAALLHVLDAKTGINETVSKLYMQEFIANNLVDVACPFQMLEMSCGAISQASINIKACMVSQKGEMHSSSAALPNTPTQMRDVLAEELARALEEGLGITPSATRDGIYDQCLSLVLKAVNCSVAGRKIAASNPADRMPLISRAIKSFRVKEKFSLLEVDCYPGLSGPLST